MSETTLHELRCVLWHDEERGVLVDAELVTGGGDQPWTSVALATGACATSRLAQNGPMPTGAKLAEWFRRAIGDPAIDDLLDVRARKPDTHVRLAIRALDRATARLPYETLVWPPERTALPLVSDPRRSISIVRVPDQLVGPARDGVPPAGARDPGRYRAVALTPKGDRVAASLREAVKGLEARVDELRPPSTKDEATRMTDLVVVGGHGRREDDPTDAGATYDAERIATGIGPDPSAVILATSDSAEATAGGVSPALTIARNHRAITLGFQGGDIGLDRIAAFLTELTRQLMSAVRAEASPSRLSLLDWERAVTEARRAIPDNAASAVMYAHPGLLAGRIPPKRAPAKASWPPGRGRAAVRGVTAIPWYVPGQVAAFAEGGRLRRVPLPVDAGARLTVEPVDAGAHEVSDRALITPSDLERLTDGWLDQGSRLRVTLSRGAWAERHWDLVATWARRSAELGAVARVLATVTRTTPPATAVAMLNEAAAEDWGTFDAAPRVLDAATGVPVRRFDRWPPLTVAAPATGWPRRTADPLDFTGVSAALPFDGTSAELIAQALASPPALLDLAERQLRAVRADPAVPPTVGAAVARGRGLVALPSTAQISEAEPGHGVRTQSDRPHDAADASDELDYSGSSS